MAIEMPELPYDSSALEPYLSAETFEYHYGKHFKTYIDTLNTMIEGTDQSSASLDDIIKGAEPGKLFNNAAQVWNHDFYFRCMAPDGGGDPPSKVADALQESFGGLDKFKEEFKTAATGQFGSGWAWVTVEGGKLAISATSNADLPLKHGQQAVMTCDVWEHAYYIDYRNKRPDYVSAFLDHLINWKMIDDAL